MEICNIYREYYQYIYNYALKLSCHPDDALDLTQSTFLRAMEKLNMLKNEQALAGWLRSICYHEFIDMTRKEPKKFQVEFQDWDMLEKEGALVNDAVPLPEEEVIVAEEISSMQNGCFLAMARKLTLHQRIVFSMVDMFGISIDDVAGILDISRSAAKGLLYRARMNIDSFFSDHCSIIYEKNPCSCRGWIEFSENRSNLQKEGERLLRNLDFKAKNYKYDDVVRKKLLYLYGHMPEQKPSEEWYLSVLKVLDQKGNKDSETVCQSR